MSFGRDHSAPSLTATSHRPKLRSHHSGFPKGEDIKENGLGLQSACGEWKVANGSARSDRVAPFLRGRGPVYSHSKAAS